MAAVEWEKKVTTTRSFTLVMNEREAALVLSLLGSTRRGGYLTELTDTYLALRDAMLEAGLGHVDSNGVIKSSAELAEGAATYLRTLTD